MKEEKIEYLREVIRLASLHWPKDRGPPRGMIFFQNPADEGDYISWNQRATFHRGDFDHCGSFLPYNVFTQYGGKGLKDQVFLTFEEAEKVALKDFIDMEKKTNRRLDAKTT